MTYLSFLEESYCAKETQACHKMHAGQNDPPCNKRLDYLQFSHFFKHQCGDMIMGYKHNA